MPLFDFECLGCGEIREQLIMGSERPACPSCGSEELKKLIGVPAPVGKSREAIGRARQQAAAAGHLSNYSSSERSSK
jgi:putative FmdB family regulatory protein